MNNRILNKAHLSQWLAVFMVAAFLLLTIGAVSHVHHDDHGHHGHAGGHHGEKASCIWCLAMGSLAAMALTWVFGQHQLGSTRRVLFPDPTSFSFIYPGLRPSRAPPAV